MSEVGEDLSDFEDSFKEFVEDPFDPDKGLDTFNRFVDFQMGMNTLGTLEFKGGKVSPRGTRRAEKDAKERINVEIRERARERQRELNRREIEAREASFAAERLRNVSARRGSARGSGKGVSLPALGQEEDLLGL